MAKPRIAVFVEHYLPGFRGGGPVRSVSALVEHLGDEIDFFVITRDRDVGDHEPYPDVGSGRWTSVGKARVFYLAPRNLGSTRLVRTIREIQPDAVYLNGFFSPMSLRLTAARRLGALGKIPVVLAPRGELSPGALGLKRFKKLSLLRFSHWTGMHGRVVFHASSERERREIASALTVAEALNVAGNIVTLSPFERDTRAKAVGTARFVFLSRITRKKNLHLAIDFLKRVDGMVSFDIYGPVSPQDEGYWRHCRSLIDELPPHVTVTYRGAVEHHEVPSTLARYDFFLFPTASENFCHAIVEAWLAGCPVLTSDQTPWLGLPARGIGWDLPLNDGEAWRTALQACIDMDGAAYAHASRSARTFVSETALAGTVAENRRLFRAVLAIPTSAL